MTGVVVCNKLANTCVQRDAGEEEEEEEEEEEDK
jgi:hypothetical protein